MKRLIMILISICMLFSIFAVGCGSKEGADTVVTSETKNVEAEPVTTEEIKEEDVNVTWSVTYKPELFKDFIDSFQAKNSNRRPRYCNSGS